MIYLYISLFALILLIAINITEHFYFIKKFTIYSVDFETHDVVFLTQNKNMSIVLNVKNNIFEIDDPTNKVIDYAIFFNKKIINVSFTKLLNEVASFMFEEEPEKFFNSELKEKLNLTSDKTVLIRYLQISPTQYIEGNLCAAEIIKRIKMIMEKFNINDEIYLKFKDE
jgi:hypothetical protein